MPKFILLVDDSANIRSLTRIYLETHSDFTVCGEASDGVEAVAKALELSPDLIVMDLVMPRMNGMEAAHEIRQSLPHLPIILFTLHKSMVSDTEAEVAGVSAIVSKLGEQKILMSEIAKLLDRPRRLKKASRR